MATYEKPKPSNAAPRDLLPVIRESGVLTDRQFADVKARVLAGDYPSEPSALADRLVQDGVLTAYQTKRFLAGKSYGLVVGRYVILERLGSGSMGRVYKAHHMMMDRLAAIKIVAPEIASNERVVARFQREMKLVGRLDHPNVIRAFDADQIGQVLYIVMEYARGGSLAEQLRKGPISPARMVDYAAQAAHGLGHAHDQGIVHRDVKPSNLLLTDSKVIKVLDLGLGVLMEADNSTAFATADGIAVGTVDYMSPEQACGRDVDGRSDLYSLGCSMYHLMTGTLPFPGDSPIERMGKRINGRHVPITDVRPDLPPQLVRVIDKLLAPRPDARFQTAAEAADALQALIRPKARPSPSASSSGVQLAAERRIEPAPQPPPAPAPAAEAAPEVDPDPVPAAVREPETTVIQVAPEYPRWFRPIAGLAEGRPAAALAALLAWLVVIFAVGYLTASLLG